jgi:thymidylate synthase (FAD)
MNLKLGDKVVVHDGNGVTEDVITKIKEYKRKEMMYDIEIAYLKLIGLGISPQIARSVLPNSLKTEIVMTMNLREWRHFFKLRTSAAAHPQMRDIANTILAAFKTLVPVVFEDINNA